MFLMFDTTDEFNTWLNQVNIALDYPNLITKTQQYTDILPTRNGEVICSIDENCPPQLLDGKNLYNYDEIKELFTDNNQ